MSNQSSVTGAGTSPRKPAFRFEMPNGESFHVQSYIARLLRSQDLNAWRDKPEEFDRWIKSAVIEAINNTTAKLWFPRDYLAQSDANLDAVRFMFEPKVKL